MDMIPYYYNGICEKVKVELRQKLVVIFGSIPKGVLGLAPMWIF